MIHGSGARVSIGCPRSPHRNTTPSGPVTLVQKVALIRDAHHVRAASLTRSAECSTANRGVFYGGRK